MLASTWADARSATRAMTKNPGWTLAVVATLTLGIGACTAIFGILDAVLLESLPYRDADRLVRLFEEREEFPRFPVAPGNFLDYRERSETLDGLVAYMRSDAELSGDGEPVRLSGMLVSAGFFELLGRPPVLGRDFSLADERSELAEGVIIGHSLWQERWGGDADILGRKLSLDGRPYTVIGVAPAGLEHVGGSYRSLPQGARVDVWRMGRLDPENPRRNAHFLNVLGRLAPEASLADAMAELDVITGQLGEEYPDTNRGWSVMLTPLTEEIVAGARPLLVAFALAVLLLLALACANVANLLLARGLGRSGELAVRTALGASRLRLVRLLVVESLIVALVGGVGGLGLAAGAMSALRQYGADLLPRAHSLRLDGDVFAFALALSIVTGLAAGVFPALRSTAGRLGASGRGTVSVAGRGLRGALVAFQLALASVLLVGAGLLMTTFVNLLGENPGFDPEQTVTASVSLPRARYAETEEVNDFWLDLIDELSAAPGVVAAGAGSDLPWSGWDENLTLLPEGAERSRDRMFRARFHQATPGYFSALGVPVIAGRELRREDGVDGDQPVVVNRSLVRAAWGDGDREALEAAVGRRVAWSSQPDEGDWFRIVGVVDDVKDDPGASTTPPSIYYPLPVWSTRTMALVLRSEVSAAPAVDLLRRTVRERDADLPLAEVETLLEIARGPVARPRFASLLLVSFAVVALVISVVGLAGLISYTVAQRRREVALRLALGATPRELRTRVLASYVGLIVVGLGFGAVGALGFARLLASQLHEVAPSDPVTLVSCCAILAGAALLVSWNTARRATSVDPAQVLSGE